ncbi:RNA methyltransferase [Hyphobacterium sp. CCMP332]|nr:RNA methyltransferase [Hyphobacterium sp. CCMP332]
MRKLEMPELNRISIEEFKNSEKIPVIVVLDNIRSMNNVGSVFRTSDAFRVEKILLCGITAKPPHRDINKTALGADKSVDWEYHESILEAIKALKKDNFKIIGIEQTNESVDLNSFTIDNKKKYALVFGNEAFGLSDEILPELDLSLEIPQFGTKHSLNISVCAGVVLWEFWKMLKVKN